MPARTDLLNAQWLRWLPAVLWASLIFWASSRPASLIPLIPVPHADKGIHFLEFAVLCYLICWAQQLTERRFKMILWLAVLMTSTYGAFDEYHQRFTPERTPEVADWLADTLGAVAAGFLWLRLRM
ncbi:MAG TPA: VanZ family protein [Candidatus Avalokitesvara rifleensis]|uniref:VanZ family protein n=1 Tax=Candidatus Avalokitesvara rifleensis TaxID=3367620 RepID=UPI002713F541|nr:VanZ family protein [Candidatus Brocadiales bacterium]